MSTGHYSTVEITDKKLAEFFTHLASQILKYGLRRDSVCIFFSRELDMIEEPVMDGEGRAWADWEDSGSRKLRVEWELNNLPEKSGETT